MRAYGVAFRSRGGKPDLHEIAARSRVRNLTVTAVFELGTSATVSLQLPPLTAEELVPRYYFNIYDGVSLPDDTGTELLDWREARVEAILLAGTIFRDNAKTIALGEDWHIEVTDERQLVLFRFDFISQEAPVLSSQRRTSDKPT